MSNHYKLTAGKTCQESVAGIFMPVHATPIWRSLYPHGGVLMHLQIPAVSLSVRQWDRQGLLFQFFLLSHESNYSPFKNLTIYGKQHSAGNRSGIIQR